MIYSNILLHIVSTIQRILQDNERRLHEISQVELIFHEVRTPELTDKTQEKITH